MNVLAKLAQTVLANAISTGIFVALAALVFEQVMRPRLAGQGLVYVIDFWPGPFPSVWFNLWLTVTVVGVILTSLWNLIKFAFRQRREALRAG